MVWTSALGYVRVISTAQFSTTALGQQDDGEPGIDDARGEDRGEGLAGAHAGPVAEPSLRAHADRHAALHEVRLDDRRVGAARAKRVAGRQLERLGLGELGEEPIAHDAGVGVTLERGGLRLRDIRLDVGVTPELGLRAIEQERDSLCVRVGDQHLVECVERVAGLD